MIDAWMAARCRSVSFIHMFASSSAWITTSLAKLVSEKPNPFVEGAAVGGLPGRVAPHVDVEDCCHVLGMVDGVEWAVGVVGLPVNDHDAAGRPGAFG